MITDEEEWVGVWVIPYDMLIKGLNLDGERWIHAFLKSISIMCM